MIKFLYYSFCIYRNLGSKDFDNYKVTVDGIFFKRSETSIKISNIEDMNHHSSASLRYYTSLLVTVTIFGVLAIIVITVIFACYKRSYLTL